MVKNKVARFYGPRCSWVYDDASAFGRPEATPKGGSYRFIGRNGWRLVPSPTYLRRSGMPVPGRPLNLSCTAGHGTAGGLTRRRSSASSRSSVVRAPEGRRPHSRWSSRPGRTCWRACARSELTSQELSHHHPHTIRWASPTDSSQPPRPHPLLLQHSIIIVYSRLFIYLFYSYSSVCLSVYLPIIQSCTWYKRSVALR